MDIGTAKPSAADRAAVRHHCIDLVDPWVDFTVTEYRRAYDEAVGTVTGRPLLVAGTGLYLTAVIDRLDVPGVWPKIRAELAGEDLGSLWRRLGELDPAAAARIEPGNRRRVVRALEVCLGSGRPFSSFGPGVGSFPPTEATMIGLRWPRPVLATRIEQRVAAMLAAGLLDEVSRLAAGGLSRTARQALGYKELLDHLEGRSTLDAAVAAIITRTRRFAVRQERWFRRDPRVRWYDVDLDPVSELAPTVADALQT
jgi:tRNA dimethylallyltransferase